MTEKKNILINAVIVGLVILFTWFSIYLISPPKPVSSDAPLDAFSSERAMKYVRDFCQKPHPTGSEEIHRVRDGIIKELKALGLHTEIQAIPYLNESNNTIVNIENIIGVLKGTDEGKAVLLVGHYDSQPHTPGAADDGIAVASMLETARALKQSPQLKNDIIFLFTDNEEFSLSGAAAFVNKHPLRKKIGILFNIEARGNKGPSYTFETSSENGWIIKEYAKAIPHPFASSMMYEIYKQLPNDTDFTIFKTAANGGYPGFNAAIVDGFVNYHSRTDTPDNLDQGSLQHDGSYFLNFAKHFGNLPLDSIKEKDVTYFNPMGSWFVHYPATVNTYLLILVLFLYIVVLIRGIIKKRLTIKGILGSFVLYAVTFALIGGLSWLLQTFIKSLYPHYANYYMHNFYNVDFYFILLTASAIAVASAIYSFAFSRTAVENLEFGAATLFIVPLVLLYLRMPTASYLLLIPILLYEIKSIIFCGAGILENHPDNKRYNIYAFITLIASLPLIALFTPMIKTLFISFGLDMTYIAVGTLVLLIGFTLPLFKMTYNLNKAALPILALLVMIASFIGAHVNSKPTETQPLKSCINYYLDADKGKAYWTSVNLNTDEWNKQFFTTFKTEPLTEIYPKDERLRIKSDAPMIRFSYPQIDWITTDKPDTPKPGENAIDESQTDENQSNPNETTENESAVKEDKDSKRQLNFTVRSLNKSNAMEFLFTNYSVISSMKINGVRISKKLLTARKKDYGYVAYLAIGGEGVKFDIECKKGKKVYMTIVEKKLGIPDGEKYPQFKSFQPMPSHVIPSFGMESYITAIKKTVVL